ncbi:rhodanese-related sulfurtransferase [bacterium]|nr:rhodanese-related sulfurtransferase [bacterium]NBX98577.1 rhodanese-related sulfurtransferase [bacterium]NDC95086.1 rhodanese-related sulfurtransferase [bacterium]NDD84833.1 rhodanese-related sulfurtransferase [bacterium]NDG29524.1 rhodanese-related sulfurtransferase [bacterium]
MQKIILFYKFVPISDTETIMFWQRTLCEKLGLKGRILISPHGINATLGGDLKQLKYYTREMNSHSLFDGITYKWSEGGLKHFPKLKVKIKQEIVAFDAADEIIVGKNGIQNGGKHLKPAALHKLVQEKGDDVIFYDGRNMYEAQIGKFKNAVIPNTTTSRDFKEDLEHGEISKFKDKPIVTYCTGGIRCEILSAMMINRGYSEVYQLDGGIAKYGEKYADDGLWEGKLFVFDDRMSMGFSDKAKDIATCETCGTKTSNLVNSSNIRRKLHVVCQDCAKIPIK